MMDIITLKDEKKKKTGFSSQKKQLLRMKKWKVSFEKRIYILFVLLSIFDYLSWQNLQNLPRVCYQLISILPRYFKHIFYTN